MFYQYLNISGYIGYNKKFMVNVNVIKYCTLQITRYMAARLAALYRYIWHSSYKDKGGNLTPLQLKYDNITVSCPATSSSLVRA